VGEPGGADPSTVTVGTTLRITFRGMVPERELVGEEEVDSAVVVEPECADRCAAVSLAKELTAGLLGRDVGNF
jgi:hypothetical protein